MNSSVHQRRNLVLVLKPLVAGLLFERSQDSNKVCGHPTLKRVGRQAWPPAPPLLYVASVSTRMVDQAVVSSRSGSRRATLGTWAERKRRRDPSPHRHTRTSLRLPTQAAPSDDLTADILDGARTATTIPSPKAVSLSRRSRSAWYRRRREATRNHADENQERDYLSGSLQAVDECTMDHSFRDAEAGQRLKSGASQPDRRPRRSAAPCAPVGNTTTALGAVPHG